MPFDYLIEVAVTPETSTTERGGILETFAKRFLETQNYAVTQQVRFTASEVDLLGQEKSTSENIFVECKAHRSNISAEVLHKLLGNVIFKNYSSGWLISTYQLSKDAKGFQLEWNQKSAEERRKIRIYTPENLVERLASAGLIKRPESLLLDNQDLVLSNDAVLLLTTRGEFWALPILDGNSHVRNSAALFNASTGKQVSDEKLLDWISGTDTTVTLPWITSPTYNPSTAISRLTTELESIVRVPVADHWADYRPARPEDYVGRETIQSEIFEFFDRVRNKQTSTRLIAIKAPSGWGKSSSVLKLAARAANIRNRNKYFVFTADSRAATTRRFPELAVITAIKDAISAGFLSQRDDLRFGGSSNFFSTDEMQAIGKELEKEGKVICVFFDQFEELLYKEELVEVFNEMRRICSSVEEAQLNLIIGFSWKTDGALPSEHNAYHMWHSLADRRYEIELPPFTEREVALAINRFAKELGQPIIPQLRRLLHDHCQGFPWLLKKLCVHILESSRNGVEQIDTLNRSINIQALFKKDLENLTSIETGCLRQIATDSPAEFFKIAQNYGDEVISILINRRLIIRSGTKLTLYWDIFRDYILTERIPYIPVSYIPQSDFARYAKVINHLEGLTEVAYDDLAKSMNLSLGAIDNIVRDMANVGHVETSRKEARINTSFRDEKHAIEIAYNFWKSHEIVRKLQHTKTDESQISYLEFVQAFKAINKRSDLTEQTIQTYAHRVIRWLKGVGLLIEADGAYRLSSSPTSKIQSLDGVRPRTMSNSNNFYGASPYKTVVAALTEKLDTDISKASLVEKYGTNALNTLNKLGFLNNDGKIISFIERSEIGLAVASRAIQRESVKITLEILKADPKAKGLEIGQVVSQRLELGWTPSTQKRNGNGLKAWARHCEVALGNIADNHSAKLVSNTGASA